MSRAIGFVLFLHGFLSQYALASDGGLYLVIGAALVLYSQQGSSYKNAYWTFSKLSLDFKRKIVVPFLSHLSILRANA
jgi:hypothetical protein